MTSKTTPNDANGIAGKTRTWSYTRNPENTRWIIDSAPAHAIACTAGYACDDERIARLIASAPELLAALENLADFCEQVFVKPRENQELQDAIAAISKATRDNVGGV